MILLQGVLGSKAYGLDNENSDTDRLGIYLEPIKQILGLNPPTNKNSTNVFKNPDKTLHGLNKFMRLAIGANPTILELLWLESYEQKHQYIGYELVEKRNLFLSKKPVRDSFFGYATQQFKKLENRGGKSFSSDIPERRVGKHARHLLRLLQQGYGLYTTGNLQVRLPDEWRNLVLEFGEAVQNGEIDWARRTLRYYEDAFDSAKSPLPEYPDEDALNRWLYHVRENQVYDD